MTQDRTLNRENGRLRFMKNGQTLEGINEEAFEYYTRLKKIKEFAVANYAEDITLRKAAQIAAMERTYFCTFFRQKVGITFGEWLRLLRVSRAIEMMKERNYTISHIAFAVGFGDLRTFERAFKLFTGKTPSAFRQQVRPS